MKWLRGRASIGGESRKSGRMLRFPSICWSERHQSPRFWSSEAPRSKPHGVRERCSSRRRLPRSCGTPDQPDANSDLDLDCALHVRSVPLFSDVVVRKRGSTNNPHARFVEPHSSSNDREVVHPHLRQGPILDGEAVGRRHRDHDVGTDLCAGRQDVGKGSALRRRELDHVVL